MTNLIGGLKKHIQTSNGKADLVDWFNWFTMDVVCDLSFGEPFNCLKNATYHPWVTIIKDGTKTLSLAHVTTRFPPLGRLLRLYIPKKNRQAREAHTKLSIEKVNRRLDLETSRPDFVGYTLRHNNEKGGMTRAEIQREMSSIIGAGSDTTATALMGMIYFLLVNPHCLKQAHEEIRDRFKNAEDIDLAAIIADLPYLQAVIDESFRIYPPALAGQARITPKGGAMVSGHWVPEGVSVPLYCQQR